MRNMVKVLALVLVFWGTQTLLAQAVYSPHGSKPNDSSDINGLDKGSKKAMERTVELLRDKGKRQKAISETPTARKADDYVGSIGNDRDRERIYEIAAQIFQTKIIQTKGNSRELDKMLMGDPEQVFRSFTPKQQQMIRELASEIEGRSSPPPR